MDYFAINKNSYFEHHGILGQKWGKKNGPPYPLDYDKLSSEERSKDKQRAISEGDAETVAYKNNKKYYSNQEMQDVINRYRLNSQISEFDAKDKAIKAGKPKTEKLLETMETVTKVGNKLASGINAGSNIYNNVAKIMNALGDADLPIIGEKKDKKDKKKQTTKIIDEITGTISETVKDSEGNSITRKYKSP